MAFLTLSLYELVGFIVLMYVTFVFGIEFVKFFKSITEENYIMVMLGVYVVVAAVIIYCWPLLLISVYYLFIKRK